MTNKIEIARRLILDTLDCTGAPIDAREVYRRALGVGISLTTLQRARRSFGYEVQAQQLAGQSWWRLWVPW
jgi:hypothetical protein